MSPSLGVMVELDESRDDLCWELMGMFRPCSVVKIVTRIFWSAGVVGRYSPLTSVLDILF